MQSKEGCSDLKLPAVEKPKIDHFKVNRLNAKERKNILSMINVQLSIHNSDDATIVLFEVKTTENIITENIYDEILICHPINLINLVITSATNSSMNGYFVLIKYDDNDRIIHDTKFAIVYHIIRAFEKYVDKGTDTLIGLGFGILLTGIIATCFRIFKK